MSFSANSGAVGHAREPLPPLPRPRSTAADAGGDAAQVAAFLLPVPPVAPPRVDAGEESRADSPPQRKDFRLGALPSCDAAAGMTEGATAHVPPAPRTPVPTTPARGDETREAVAKKVEASPAVLSLVEKAADNPVVAGSCRAPAALPSPTLGSEGATASSSSFPQESRASTVSTLATTVDAPPRPAPRADAPTLSAQARALVEAQARSAAQPPLGAPQSPRREIARLRPHKASPADSALPAAGAAPSTPRPALEPDAAQSIISRLREATVKGLQGRDEGSNPAFAQASSPRRVEAEKHGGAAPGTILRAISFAALRPTPPSTLGRVRVAKDLGRLLDQVRGRVERLRMEGGGQVELRLDPAELGSLTLRLERDGAGWRLDISAARPETAQEILRQARDLQDQLARAGLRLEELRLSESLPSRHGAAATGRESRVQADAQGQGASHGEKREEGGRDAAEVDSAVRPSEEFASRLGKLLREGAEKGQAS